MTLFGIFRTWQPWTQSNRLQREWRGGKVGKDPKREDLGHIKCSLWKKNSNPLFNLDPSMATIEGYPKKLLVASWRVRRRRQILTKSVIVLSFTFLFFLFCRRKKGENRKDEFHRKENQNNFELNPWGWTHGGILLLWQKLSFSKMNEEKKLILFFFFVYFFSFYLFRYSFRIISVFPFSFNLSHILSISISLFSLFSYHNFPSISFSLLYYSLSIYLAFYPSLCLF